MRVFLSGVSGIKKARMSKSKFKAMLIVFFDINGIVMTKWVPEGQTVNQTYYLSVLATLREGVRKKRPELWKNNSWILHQGNAPVLQHAPYSPDLAPCDFFVSEDKSCFERDPI